MERDATEESGRPREDRQEPPKDLSWAAEQISLHWRKWTFALLGLVLAFALIRGVTTTFITSQAPVVVKEGLLGDPEKDEVLIRAWIDRNPIRAGKSARLWYRIQNHSREAVGQIQALVRAPGFRWPNVRLAPRIEIPPGHQWTASIVLVPAEREGLFSISTALEWREGTRLRQGSVAVESVQIVSSSLLFAANATESLLQMLQVLALPAAIALFGAIFQFTQQRLALERQQAQHKDTLMQQEAQHQASLKQQEVQQQYALDQQAAQQRLSIERQAWADMLPNSHDNNVKYYLPLLESAGLLALRARELQKPGGHQEPEMAFFNLLQMLRRNRQTPGYFFVDRQGEMLAFLLWMQIINRLFSGLAATAPPITEQKVKTDLSALVDLLEPEDSFSSFQKRLGITPGSQSGRKALQERFVRWAAGSPPDIALLSLYTEFVLFEVNRIYKFWYGTPPDFPTEEYTLSLELLKKCAESPSFEPLLCQLERYVSSLEEIKRSTAGGDASRGPRVGEGSDLDDRGSHGTTSQEDSNT